MDVRQHANIKESQPRQMKLWSLLLAKSHHQLNTSTKQHNDPLNLRFHLADAFLPFAPLELGFNAPQIVVWKVKNKDDTHLEGQWKKHTGTAL